jgi:hypothetical protein
VRIMDAESERAGHTRRVVRQHAQRDAFVTGL